MSKTIRIVIGAVIAVIVFVVVLSVALGGHKTTPPVAPMPSTSAPMAPAAPATTPPPAPSTPSTPAMTAGQQQAVESAQSYLSDGQGFSYAGLLQQLTSSSGEGFSNADSTFAINYLNPNWDQQAVESAKNYLSDGQGFSKDGLIQQLDSPYGEQFTQAQATYGVDQAMG